MENVLSDVRQDSIDRPEFFNENSIIPILGNSYRVTRILKEQEGKYTLAGNDVSNHDKVAITAIWKEHLPAAALTRLEHEMSVRRRADN